MDAPGVILQDNPSEQLYPMPLYAEGKIDTFVGRIRKDPDTPNGFHLWIVSDNLLKGAAWNSVQIAETLVEKGYFYSLKTGESLMISQFLFHNGFLYFDQLYFKLVVIEFL